MNIKEARAAIEAILAAIPDSELPEFDKVEVDADGRVCVWWGSQGRYLGSAKRRGIREPLVYRGQASWEAIQLEITARADQRFLANGDSAEGIRLAKKKVAH